MKQLKKQIPQKLRPGIPLQVHQGDTIRLEAAEKPFTVHIRLLPLYGMAEVLKIPPIPDENIPINERQSGYPKSEYTFALATNAFIVGDFMEDLEALMQDVAIQKAIWA